MQAFPDIEGLFGKLSEGITKLDDWSVPPALRWPLPATTFYRKSTSLSARAVSQMPGPGPAPLVPTADRLDQPGDMRVPTADWISQST